MKRSHKLDRLDWLGEPGTLIKRLIREITSLEKHEHLFVHISERI